MAYSNDEDSKEVEWVALICFLVCAVVMASMSRNLFAIIITVLILFAGIILHIMQKRIRR